MVKVFNQKLCQKEIQGTIDSLTSSERLSPPPFLASSRNSDLPPKGGADEMAGLK